MSPSAKRRLVIAGIICLIACDRLLKAAALALPPGEEIRLVGSDVVFELFRNRGIAFSLPFSGPLVWLLSIGILLIVAAMAWRDFKNGRFGRAEAYLLFMLGAFSNFFDRIVYGFTVDYLIFFSRSAVNLADGMIVAGAALLLFFDGHKRIKT